MIKSVLHLDATAQAELVRKGEITPLELVDAAIDAIATLNPQLNAVVTPMYEPAREIARKPLPDAPFRGVPMLLKDGLATYKGVRMTSGSALFKNHIAQEDSELVRRFKRAGFIIIGKTNLPEFGIMAITEPRLHGPCRNPWNTALTPGGSSGGSAAAVAARLVPVAHANDGGGSIRIPASCCGLFGLKPTRGRTPLGPAFSELISGLVIEHVLTRSVRDSAAILDLTAGPDIGDYYGAPVQAVSYLQAVSEQVQPLRIGYSTCTPMGKPVHELCKTATLEAAQLCRGLGHSVTEMEIPLPFEGRQMAAIFSTLWAVGATTALSMIKKVTGKEPPRHLVEPLTWALYEQAQATSAADYELTRLATHKIARSIGKTFEKIDVWLSPTLALPPVAVGSITQHEAEPLRAMSQMSEFAPMTAIFNISGQPAASVPVFWSEDEVPIGVQMVGKFGREETLFQLAAQLEKELKWQRYIPRMAMNASS